MIEFEEIITLMPKVQNVVFHQNCSTFSKLFLTLSPILFYTLVDFKLYMLIRLRTPLGVWRIKDLNKHSTIEEVMQIASLEHSVTFDGDLALNPDFSNVLRPSRTLGSLGIEHGDMIYGRLDEEESKKAGDASQTKRVIGSDGTIFTQVHHPIHSIE